MVWFCPCLLSRPEFPPIPSKIQEQHRRKVQMFATEWGLFWVTIHNRNYIWSPELLLPGHLLPWVLVPKNILLPAVISWSNCPCYFSEPLSKQPIPASLPGPKIPRVDMVFTCVSSRIENLHKLNCLLNLKFEPIVLQLWAHTNNSTFEMRDNIRVSILLAK